VSEAIGRPGGAALPRPMGIGEILSAAFQLYQRYWRTLLAIAAVVVVPFTLLQYLLGHAVRVTGVATSNGVVVTTSSWRVGLAGLVTALAGVVMFLVLTGAITRALVVEGRRPTEAMGRSWALVGGHWWHAFGILIVAGLLTGLVNALITAPFNQTSWFLQAVVAAIATVITLPYGTLVGVLLYLDLRARKEQLTLERLRVDLQASAT
jgi:hypothetical protein